LRDVVVGANGLWVSRFRSAEILRLDANGKVTARISPPDLQAPTGTTQANVAYRMIRGHAGGVVMVHQRSFAGEVVPTPGGYSGGDASGIMHTAVTKVDEEGRVLSTTAMISASVPVDVAESEDSALLLIAAAATPQPNTFSLLPRSTLVDSADLLFTPEAEHNGFAVTDGAFTASLPRAKWSLRAYRKGTIVQMREPSALVYKVAGCRFLVLP
jgi:hypothetical protein